MRRLLLASLIAACAAVAAPAAAQAASPSRASAKRFGTGPTSTSPRMRRRFALQGGRRAVTAADGSRITAWNIVIANSGDGAGRP